jgi:hypothetical protein
MDPKVIERVRKLLELAHNNENVGEAANAASAAQTLMSRHAISEAMLGASSDTPDEAIEPDVLYASSGTQNATWRGQLAVPMCEVNGCGVFQARGALHVFGRPSDAAKVRYLFSYVCAEIERLCQRESSLRGSPGRTWANSFKLGAAAEIGRRLREADQAARGAMKREADAGDTMGTGSALVLVNTALAKIDAHRVSIAEYGRAKLKLGKGKKAKSNVDYRARDAGRRAAADIDLSGAAQGSLGSGARKSLGG